MYDAAGIRKEDIIFYQREGYLVLEGYFSAEECDEMLAIFRNHANPHFRALMNIEREIPEVKKFITTPELVGVLEGLHGTTAMGYLGTQVLFKEVGSPFAKHGWRAHQDNSYIEAPYGTYCSAIISLADSDSENGGMYLYPGSHKEPLLPYVAYESFDPCVDPGNEVEIPAGYQWMVLSLKRGSLYVQHGNLIHGSYPNLSTTRSRPHFGIMCIVGGVRFNRGKNSLRQFTSFHEEES